MLGKEHRDDSYRTVDEIEELLKAQICGNSKKITAALRFPADTMSTTSQLAAWFTERSKTIPMRLTFEERKIFRLVRAVICGSEYTDVVDGRVYKDKHKRFFQVLKCLRATLMGILVSLNHKHGKLVAAGEVELSDFAEVFTKVFEIGRRYKIMNPGKMRGSYGKLIYLLQDAMSSESQEELGFQCVRPIRTVYDVLVDGGAEAVLQDKYIATATMEILPQGKSRAQIQKEIKQMERAMDLLARKYSAKSRLAPDDIKQCLHSIKDNQYVASSVRFPRYPASQLNRCLCVLQLVPKLECKAHRRDYHLPESMVRSS